MDSIHVDAAGPPEGNETDTPAPDGKCPKCGGEVQRGFGLAYDGYGPYEFCLNECGWFWKWRLPHDAD